MTFCRLCEIAEICTAAAEIRLRSMWILGVRSGEFALLEMAFFVQLLGVGESSFCFIPVVSRVMPASALS